MVKNYGVMVLGNNWKYINCNNRNCWINYILQIKISFLRIFMKNKMRDYLAQFSPKQVVNSLHQYSYKSRVTKTFGSESNEERVPYNTSVNDLTHYYSPNKTKNNFNDFLSLVEENKRLKSEIKQLKQLQGERSHISNGYHNIEQIVRPNGDQIKRLKKLLQKAYYSIKQMQQQNNRLNKQLQLTVNELKSTQKKCKILQLQSEQCQQKISNITLIHRQEMQVLLERIRRLDQRTQQLMEIIEQDQNSWTLHMQELNNLKKFYSGRTYK